MANDSHNLQPPFFGPGFPVYPHLTQSLRITGTTRAGSGASTLYDAYVQQINPTTQTPRDREQCLVKDLNAQGLSAGYYTGRLASQDGGLPVYVVSERSTASGSGSGSGCGSGVGTTIYETDTECVSGLLNVYQRSVELSILNGCLTLNRGAWTFLRNAGCCGCDGSGSGGSGQVSGSGSGQGGCCPNALPTTLPAVITQVGALGDCACSVSCQDLVWNPTASILHAIPGGSYVSTGAWVWTGTLCGEPVEIALVPCVEWLGIGTVWVLRVRCGSGDTNIASNIATMSCDIATTPVVFGPLVFGNCCVATDYITIGGSSSCGSGSGSGTGSGSGSGSGGGIDGCGCTNIPQALYVTLANTSGCACIAGSYGLTWTGGLTWVHSGGTTVCSGKILSMQLTCNAGIWTFSGTCNGVDPWSINSTSTQCSPFQLTFGVFTLNDCCLLGTVTPTVTV